MLTMSSGQEQCVVYNRGAKLIMQHVSKIMHSANRLSAASGLEVLYLYSFWHTWIFCLFLLCVSSLPVILMGSVPVVLCVATILAPLHACRAQDIISCFVSAPFMTLCRSGIVVPPPMDTEMAVDEAIALKHEVERKRKILRQLWWLRTRKQQR